MVIGIDMRSDIIAVADGLKEKNIGHGLGKADLSVFDAINKDAQIIYYYHRTKERDAKEVILRELGFNVEMVSDTCLYL